jgi:hypothetical protein
MNASPLLLLVASHRDVEQARISAGQRGLVQVEAELRKIEDNMERYIDRELRAHPLYDWLPIRGVQVARVIAIIRDPWRFPGRLCRNGHHVSSRYDGEACPAEIWGDGDDVCDHGMPCGAPLGPVRPGTGVRSLWHYAGLIPGPDGRLLHRRRGHQATYRPDLKTALLMPKGIADQLIMHRIQPYRGIYDAYRERMSRAESVRESDTSAGSALRIHRRGRVIVAKAFLGDLLIAWKARTVDAVAAA